MEHPAHIRSDGAVQTVREHCEGAALLCERKCTEIGLGKTAYLCGLLHDAGKCTEQFKNYIEKAAKGEEVRRGSVIHSFAAVRYLLTKHHDIEDIISAAAAELISVAVGSHHGIFDCFDKTGSCGFTYRVVKQPEYDDGAMASYWEEVAQESEIDRLFDIAKAEVKSKIKAIFSFSKSSKNPDEFNYEFYFYFSLLSRFLISALIDADRTDTAHFDSGDSFSDNAGETSSIWEQCLLNYNSYMSTFPSESPIQRARQELSDICLKASEKPSGIFRLNIPTGGGKTLSGLRFALNHAQKHGKKRIFFISPLLTILEQNAERIREAIGNDAVILEHHSDIILEDKTDEELSRYEHLCESWESPVVITTLVQLLNALFSGKSSSVRRFHSLADSVIVIDEVQTVPTNMLSLFNSAVNFLSKICNTTVVLCSATQPEFEEIKHSLLPAADIVSRHELKKYESVFKRCIISYHGQHSISEIPAMASELLGKYKSVLVICNKKDEASNLFTSAAFPGINCYHLSAGMCIAHRKKVLSDIKSDLKSSIKTLCISTQVIEAGVDISFDAVIRLSAGLDSIVQAAGRCNRNGESRADAPVWVIDCADEDLSSLRDISDGKRATGTLIDAYTEDSKRFGGSLSSDEAVSFYYKKLYSGKEGYFDYTVGDNPSIYSLLVRDIRYIGREEDHYFMHQAAKTAGELFRVFDSDQIGIVVPWKNGESIIAELLYEGDDVSKATLDRAKPYTVSVFGHKFNALLKCGAITPICGGRINILDQNYYDEDIGIKDIRKGEEICDTLIL